MQAFMGQAATAVAPAMPTVHDGDALPRRQLDARADVPADATPTPVADAVGIQPASGSPIVSEPQQTTALHADGPPADALDLTQVLLGLVSERTGYPIEMLAPTLLLEADLGVDSIKWVEILGALQRQTRRFGPDAMQRLTALKSVAQVVEALGPADHAPAAFVAAGAVEPMPATDRSAPQIDNPFFEQVVVSESGNRVAATCRLSARHEFLRDHTLGRDVSDADPELVVCRWSLSRWHWS